MEIVKKNVAELKFAPYNPRYISDTEMEKLKKSIKEFGLVEPLVWNKKTGYVVGGNQRLQALMELGVKEVDVIVIDLDDDEEKALNVALNKISGEWDFLKLKEIFEELDADLLSLTGFDENEIGNLLAEFEAIEPPDFDDEIPEDTRRIIKVLYEPEQEEKLINWLDQQGYEYRK